MTPEERKKIPVATGVLDYFPLAIMEVAKCSFAGNEQHNPGTPLHWDRSKSGDEGDALIRHFLDRGKIDTDGIRHSAKCAWRALALLQKEMEAAMELAISADFGPTAGTTTIKIGKAYNWPDIAPPFKRTDKGCTEKECECKR